MNSLADFAGHPIVFAGLIAVVASWFIAGIPLQYSDTWFSIMDVFVFLTTFFLVFVVQASQNADTRAMQAKLDEIIDSLAEADSHKKSIEKEVKKGKREL
jgi:low affinity Fe/Cu permease